MSEFSPRAEMNDMELAPTRCPQSTAEGPGYNAEANFQKGSNCEKSVK